MPLRFFNTLGREYTELIPLEGNLIRMYTCGPTVYNFAHIGNFRAYVFEDLLRRTIKYHGFEVKQVMNLTDVDDKTIRDSKAAGVPLRDYTATYKKAFFEDLETLRIEKAEHYPAATDHVPEMIELIQALLDKGYAYQAEDKSIYYSIAKFKDYGKLAKIDMENQRSGVRIKNDEYEKDSAADFALWKAWSEDDGDVFWESPWGKGRPGWHIECSAMSMKYLGKTFDLHTGGIDNMFPHHEDEIAQSEAANGCKFVNCWMHNDYLIVNGEKMSKSLGNFFTIRDLLDKGWTGPELRWVLLGTHYRKKLNFTFDSCNQARTAMKKFKEFFQRLKAVDSAGEASEATVKQVNESKQAFAEALGDDLNISKAIAATYSLMHYGNGILDQGTVNKAEAELLLEQFRDFDRVMMLFDVDSAAEEEQVPAEILELAQKRQDARKNKDFAAADAIRDQLKEAGWVIEDTAEGPKVKRI